MSYLVLQRRFSCSTSYSSSSQFGEPSLAVADGGPSIPLLPPAGPRKDLLHVPDAYLHQMNQQGSHFGHAHLRLFSPPVALVGTLGTPRPTSRASCGDASQPSRAFRTRPIRIPLSLIGYPPRLSIVFPALAPVSTAVRPPEHLNGDASIPVPDPTTSAPAIARGDQANPLR